jgi:hypothetical protein
VPPRIVTAVHPNRKCRVQVVIGNNVVPTNRPYNRRNTWQKVIAYARKKDGGAPFKLPREAEATVQVLEGDVWVVDKANQ